MRKSRTKSLVLELDSKLDEIQSRPEPELGFVAIRLGNLSEIRIHFAPPDVEESIKMGLTK
jgi:hypothetical protein